MADENMGGNQTSNSNEEMNQSSYNNTENSQNINQGTGHNSNHIPPSGQQSYNQGMNFSQAGTNPGMYSSGVSGGSGFYSQGMGQSNSYGQYGSGMYTQQGYDPYGGMYAQQGYDPYGGMYAQQGYDPYGGMYAQSGYDPYGGMYAQQGYDPYGGDMYGATYTTSTTDSTPSTSTNPIRLNVTPSNPMKVNVAPSNPATSSNNITFNMDKLENDNKLQNSSNNIPNKNEKLKSMMSVLMDNNIDIELYSNQNDEMPIANGHVNMVTNQTVSVDTKVVAIKYISYIKFSNKYITDNKIHEFFTIINTPRQKSFEYNIVNDFYNLLYSKILFNQGVNITIDASFISEIKNVNVVNLNTEICILKSSEFYYLIELDKIVSVE